MSEINVKKEIHNEMDLMKRIDRLDEESRKMILEAFYMPDLYVAMSDEGQYQKYIACIENTIKSYEKAKYAFEKLHTLCCVKMYEDTPAGQIDKMFETYESLDYDNRFEVRKQLFEKRSLMEAMDDLRYTCEKTRESLKNANNQKFE